MKRLIFYTILGLVILLTACQKKTLLTKEYPVFQEVTVNEITSVSATTKWTLNEDCYVTIDYGTSTAYGFRQEINALTNNGEFNLDGLFAQTPYYYRLTATNGKGDMSITDEACFITANQQSIESTYIEPSYYVLHFGESVNFTAKVTTSDGNPYPQYLHWSLCDDNLSPLDPNIGSINTSQGLNTTFTAGNKEGTAKLRVYGQIPWQHDSISDIVNITILPNQGSGILRGQVMFYEGNFMPGQITGTATPVRRQVYIFEKLNMLAGDVVYSSPCFFTTLNKKIIAMVESDATTGSFETVLPVGEYTICLLENGEYYANIWDGIGGIFPIVIKTNATLEILFRIDYQACY